MKQCTIVSVRFDYLRPNLSLDMTTAKHDWIEEDSHSRDHSRESQDGEKSLESARGNAVPIVSWLYAGLAGGITVGR